MFIGNTKSEFAWWRNQGSYQENTRWWYWSCGGQGWKRICNIVDGVSIELNPEHAYDAFILYVVKQYTFWISIMLLAWMSGGMNWPYLILTFKEIWFLSHWSYICSMMFLPCAPVFFLFNSIEDCIANLDHKYSWHILSFFCCYLLLTWSLLFG